MSLDSRSDSNVRVAIVDDHEMMLDGLQTGLQARAGIDVVATAATVATCVSEVERTRPDVVVADYQLPDGTGVDVARRVARTAPTIIITGLERSGLLHDVVEAGCRGLLLKTVTIAELAESIDAVANGANSFSTEDLLALASRTPMDVGATLTGREREVLQLLGQAASADAIADTLGLSINTVRKHIAAVLTKLHAKSQLEAVITAQRAGLI
ncbi:MAG: response regulator [Ilumatobacter sp.]